LIEMTDDRHSEEELLQLQKRARRRLVGAVVLVLSAVVVLWNLLDATPPRKLIGDKVVVSCAPGVAVVSDTPVPTLPASSPVSAVEKETVSVDAAPDLAFDASIVSSQEALPAEQKPEHKKADDLKPQAIESAPSVKKDPRRILEGLDQEPELSIAKSPDKSVIKYRVQVAAYSDAAKAQQVVNKLKAAGVRVSSEKVVTQKGEVTRIRVGPYASRMDAEAALKKMQAQGVNGMLVTK
jgi:DedD protein